MSERVYIIVLRNLDLPDRKLCMTSGRIASHAVHVAAKLEVSLQTGRLTFYRKPRLLVTDPDLMM